MNKFRYILLVVIGLLCSVSVNAQFFKVDGLSYKITSSTDMTVEIRNLGAYQNELSGALTIPESVAYNGNTYRVISIANWAFSGCYGLTSVKIPNSVTSIGGSAFDACTGLTSVEIPNSVTSIGNHAFCDCSSLTSVEIPNSVTSIGYYAFYGCSSLTFVEIPNSVTSIENFAFYGCSSLTSVEIPNSVTSIGDCAFYDCSSLTSVEIPNSVTSIGVYAFAGCSSVTSLVVAPDNPIYDSREGCNAIIKTSSNELIAGCKSTIIPNSVTSIGNYAFYGCSSLTSVEIPNSVTSIGNNAFYGCSSLTSVESPNSVTSIGHYAFYGCSSLNRLSCYAKVPPTCGSEVFDGIDKEKCVLQVPGSSLAAYRQADQWKDFLFIEDVLTSIGGVTVGDAVPATADVYSTNGILIKRNAELKHLKHHLPAGIYIIGGKKVLVK